MADFSEYLWWNKRYEFARNMMVTMVMFESESFKTKTSSTLCGFGWRGCHRLSYSSFKLDFTQKLSSSAFQITTSMSYLCINRSLTFSSPVAQQHADHFELYLKRSFSIWVVLFKCSSFFVFISIFQ